MNAPRPDRGGSAPPERPSARLSGTGLPNEHDEARDRQLQRASSVGCLVALVIALLGALGYVPGLQVLGSVRDDYIPMAPSTAAGLGILSGLLLAMAWRPSSKATAGVAVALAVLVGVFGALEVVEHFSGVSLNFEDRVVPTAGSLGRVPIARMSPSTGAMFCFAGAAVIGLALRPRRQVRAQGLALEHAAGLLGTLVTLSAGVFFLAYLRGTPLLYASGTTIPMALTTATGFLSLGFAIVCASGREALPLGALLGSSTRAYLLRVFVPLASSTTLVGCLIVLQSEIFAEPNPALVAAFMAVAMAVIAGIVVVFVARNVARTLDESEQRFRTLVEHAADPLFLVRADSSEFVEVNQQACDAFGYSRGELLKLSVEDIDTTFPDLRHFEEIVREVKPRRPVTIRSVGKRKDGSTFPIEVRIGAIRLRDEPHLLAVVRDMSEREEREKEQAALQERHRQGQKMEAIGRLAGGVAHDFNNLLTVILGYAEDAAEGLRDEDPVKSDMQNIAEAGHRAAMLTRQLLAFSRKQVLEPTVLDLNEVVTDLADMLKRLVGEDIGFSTVLAEDLARVTADQGQIDQILMNLAVNARDAMPAGGRLTVETANVDADEAEAFNDPEMASGPYVMLAVTDSGTGISAAAMERIFEPFFTTKDDQGTGLGLSTVYGIVKQSGGAVIVTSEPGHGTSFKVYLPRTDSVPTEPTPPPDSHRHRGTETILLVEDEALVRDLAQRILTSAGYAVLATANSGEALLECEQRGLEIDLVLTDVVMPRMGGSELVARLSPLCRPDIKVLYMSGYAGDSIARRGVLDQGKGFIPKPFKPQALLARVRALLDDA